MGFLSDNDTVVDHTEKHSENPVIFETREMQIQVTVKKLLMKL